ncbi:flavin reductase family protein [Scopulibacillus cellulosilyticus]|uniref:Flavin reductase family protein n=1 Tax=Scopulibacillus cellulosilyticus TaxID=2665665 RepID=A0ABW2PXK1_9BACL
MNNVRELRNCFGRFATGVTVVTWFGDNGQRYGITVNSFTSVSLDPPLVLISIDRKANSYNSLKGRSFVINILSKDQEVLAWQFAGREQQGLTVEWEDSSIGPKLKDALATIECEPWEEYDGGDHALYIGRVQDFSYNNGEGLLFFQGKFLQTKEIENRVKEQV